MHVNQKMDSVLSDKFLNYMCAIKQTSSEIWRQRIRNWYTNSTPLPEWSEQEEKYQGLLSATGTDKEETKREFKDEDK